MEGDRTRQRTWTARSAGRRRRRPIVPWLVLVLVALAGGIGALAATAPVAQQRTATPPSDGATAPATAATAAPATDRDDAVRAAGDAPQDRAWRCPVSGRVEFRDDFNYIKPSGRRHRGVDLYAYRGTPVVAPVDGVVAHRDGRRAGLHAVLEGDDGRRYLAVHLDRFLGGPGRVEAGDPIGTVGTSGNAIGGPPHVHFEVHEDGRPVDPYPWLAEHCR